MILKRLSQRETYIFIACVVLVTLYVGYNFVFKPMKGKVTTLTDQIDANQRRLEKNLRTMRQASSVEKKYEQYALPLKQTMSDEAQITALLSEIGAVAQQIQLSIDNMKPNKVKKVDFYNEFSVSLTLNGSLEAVIHFMYLIENAPHHFKVESMRLEKRSPRQAEIRCQLSLKRMFVL